MAIQLGPVEIDISDALNDIDTLKKQIEDAFKSHGGSEDPKITKTLQGLRGIYDSLGDIDKRMKSIEFDPNIESKVAKVNTEFNSISKALEQSKARVADFENYMKEAKFDFKIGDSITKIDDKIAKLKDKLGGVKESVENTLKAYPEFKFFDNAEQEVAQIKDKIEDLSESLKVSKGLVEEYAESFRTKHGFNLTEDMAKVMTRNAELKLQDNPADKFAKEEYALIEAWRDEQNAVKEIQQEIARLNELKSKATSYGKQTDQLKQLETQIENLSQKRDELKAKEEQQAPVIDAYKQESQELQNLSKAYTDVAASKKALDQQSNEQSKLATDFQKASDSATVLQQRLNQLTTPAEKSKKSVETMGSALNNVKNILSKITSAIKSVFSHIKSLAKSIASHVKSVLSSLLSHVKSIAKVIGHSLSSKFNSLGKSASGLTGSLEGGFKKAFRVLLKYGLGVRSLFFLFRKLRSAATEMLGEMTKQIPEVNAQMSSLKQSMNQMKGSLATLVQPLLNILVPVLSKIATLITNIIGKVASLFALITGQNYIYEATAGTVDYAKSLDKSGKSAKKAKKELEGYLSPIDEINKYQEKNKDEDDSDVGAGGDITFKKKPIDDALKDFWDWLKKMWEKGDFTELGKWLGDKLAEALGNIPWDKIKAMARKIGSSLATLINGFIQGEFDGKSVSWWIGHTLAEALNTVFEFLNEFVHKLNWRGVGKAFADFFNAIFEGIDWDLIYDTVVTGLDGIGQAIWEFITQFRWDNIYDFIKKVITTIADGIKALFNAEGYDERGFKLKGTWAQRLGTELGAQFRQLIQDQELIKTIGEAIGTIIKNGFDFAMNFIKEAFKDKGAFSEAISSFIEGILEGLGLSDEEVDGAMSWVHKVGEAFDSLVSVLSDVLTALKPLLTDIWEHFVKFIKELPDKLNSIQDSDGFKSFLDWLKGLTWDDIKNGLLGVAKALGVVAGAFAAFKGVKAIGAVSQALSSIIGLFGGGAGVAGAAGAAAGGGGIVAAAGTILEVIGIIAAIILAAGALKQIPGFEWLMKEGISMLKTFFNGLGEIIGSAISGIGVGLTSGLPAMADNLSEFANRLKPFLDTVKSIDRSAVSAVGTLAEVVAVITATDIVSACTSWFTGGNSMLKFGDELSKFGPYVKKFADSVKGIDGAAAESAANAGKALAEMAQAIPNEGLSFASILVGDNTLEEFSKQIPLFGDAMVAFSKSVKGMDASAVQQATIAGQALAALNKDVPNSWGVISLYTGDNRLDEFGKQIAEFGKGLKAFNDSIKGIDAKLIQQAATAGKTLAALNKDIPNSWGVISLFTGDNQLGDFGVQLVLFGKSLKSFSDSIKGIDTQMISKVATVSTALAEMNKTIPNCGGLVNLFVGDNKMSTFGAQLIGFGASLRLFSSEVKGVDTALVSKCASAGKALAEMNSTIPNCGGLISLFTGENKLSTFGKQLVLFGGAMRLFSAEIKGMDTTLVTNAGMAGKALGEMGQAMPKEGGLFSIFTGNNNTLNKFAEQLPLFGRAMKQFSDEVKGINPSLIQSASTAGTALGEMAKTLPNSDGVISWFTGNNNMDDFGRQLVVFGQSMKKFSEAVTGLDNAVVQNAVNAGKAIAEMAKTLPNSEGGLSSIIGDNKMDDFGNQLIVFGTSMKKFADEVSGLDGGVIQNAVNAGSAIAGLANSLPSSFGIFDALFGNKSMAVFALQLPIFGKAIKAFADEVSGIDAQATVKATIAGGAIAAMSTALSAASTINQFMTMITNGKNVTTFATQLPIFGRAIKAFADEVMGVDPNVVINSATAGQALMALSKDVPKTGGLIQMIAGQKNLAKFGQQLVVLGRSLKEYSAEVSGMNVNVVEKTVAVTQALVSLNKDLPTMGSVFSWFVGKKDFSAFGNSLVSYGKSMVEFSNSLNGINLSNMTTVLTASRELIKLANELTTTNTTSLSTFATNARSFAVQFGGLGMEYVTQFLAQFINSVASVNTAITTFVNYIIQAFKATQTLFKQVALELMQVMLTAILSKSNDFKAAAVTLTNAFISGFAGLSSGMTKEFNSGINQLKRLWDDFAGWMNKHLNIEINTSDAFGKELAESLGTSKLNIGKIPRLAQGGVIPPNKEFMAVLGDQKSGMNIETPLATMVDAFNQALAMNGGSGNSQPITLNLVLPDKRTIAQYAIEGGQVLQMSRGRNPFLLERG